MQDPTAVQVKLSLITWRELEPPADNGKESVISVFFDEAANMLKLFKDTGTHVGVPKLP